MYEYMIHLHSRAARAMCPNFKVPRVLKCLTRVAFATNSTSATSAGTADGIGV
jgi:hypothetical protein